MRAYIKIIIIVDFLSYFLQVFVMHVLDVCDLLLNFKTDLQWPFYV